MKGTSVCGCSQSLLVNRVRLLVKLTHHRPPQKSIRRLRVCKEISFYVRSKKTAKKPTVSFVIYVGLSF